MQQKRAASSFFSIAAFAAPAPFLSFSTATRERNTRRVEHALNLCLSCCKLNLIHCCINETATMGKITSRKTTSTADHCVLWTGEIKRAKVQDCPPIRFRVEEIAHQLFFVMTKTNTSSTTNEEVSALTHSSLAASVAHLSLTL